MLKRYVVLIFVLLSSLAYGQKKHVLLLNSYHEGLRWTDDIIHGFRSSFSTFNEPYEIYMESLDSKRFMLPDYYEEMYELLHQKYADIDMDVVVVADDNALDFLRTYKKRLFPDVPVVFCGVNFPHKFPVDYTGILEEVDYAGNVALIKDLFPDYDTLYIVADNTRTGNIIRQRSQELFELQPSQLRYQYLTHYSFEELYQKISSLDPGDIVLLSVFVRDKHMKYISFKESIRRISEVAKVPVFGFWDFYLGEGIIGGKLNSGVTHGRMAAEKAMLILQGQSPKEINIDIAPSKYAFDHQLLKEFDIKRRDLPANTEIVNNPAEVFEENKQLTLFFGITLLLLVTVIIVLWVYILLRRRKLKERKRYIAEIEMKNERLETARQKAEEANRLKSAFLANISHEVRTPMNGIIGFSKLLKDNPVFPEKHKQYLEIIHKSSKVLLNLINDIIDISKLESGQLNINYQEYNLNQIVDELYAYFYSEREAQRKQHIDFTLEKISGQDFPVYTDGNRVRQVLYNLVHNAFKFTSEGHIRFGYRIENDELLFFVEDTGIGMSEEEKQIAFMHFRQADESFTRKYGGTGLGLSISQGIVDKLNGRLWVTSEKGRGSTFYFTIPYYKVRKKQASFTTNGDNERYAWNKRKILVVEDSPVSMQLLSKFLQPTGVDILEATDGAEAVEMCRQVDDIDVVLMDIQLPVLDGLSATKEIKSFRPQLPIIAQTANALTEDERIIRAAGCDDYIAKPIDRRELLHLMDKYLLVKK
jgi:signal transduction histidine kinase/CheY-like chemotaxis protein